MGEKDHADDSDEDYHDDPYREWIGKFDLESSECDIAVPWLCLVPSVKKCRAIITKTLGKFTPETKEMRITMFVSRYLGCHPEKDNDMRRVLTMALQALGAQDILKALLSGGSTDAVAELLPFVKTHHAATAYTIEECKQAGFSFMQCVEMKSGHGQGKDKHEQWRREQEKGKQIAELGGRRAWEKKRAGVLMTLTLTT